MVTTEELVKLREATNRAIDEVQKQRTKGAVNWADLHCLQAAWVVTDEEESYAEVTIEEAAPEADEFQTAVMLELDKLGYPNVHVVTEW
jgi:hypothetical protein